MGEVLALLARARDRSDEVIGDVSDAQIERPAQWAGDLITVRERIHRVATHFVEVNVQAEKMLGSPDGEARRILRRLLAARGLHEGASDAALRSALDRDLVALARTIQAAVRGARV